MTEKELNSVRELKEQIRAKEWRLQALKTQAENVVPVLDGLPHATEVKSRVERLALQIVTLELELPTLREQFANAAFELGAKIDAAPLDAKAKAVLSLRYVSCLNFQDIWLKLNANDAQVFYLHRKALKIFLKN